MKRKRLTRAVKVALGAHKPSGRSDYARKHSYLAKHGLWGFEVPEPKPWRRKRKAAA